MTETANAHTASLTRKLKGLYAITDENLIPEDCFSNAVEQALRGGSRIIQYRDKSGNREKRLEQANIICSLCKKYQAISIINDDIELARAVKADGVHLGRDDGSIANAKNILGPQAIIGVSCYDDITLAIAAEKDQADYVAFGAIFSSPTKPDAASAGLSIISEAKQRLSIPVCAIGGITENNIQPLMQHGADMAAVISSLFSADNIEYAARSLYQNFD